MGLITYLQGQVKSKRFRRLSCLNSRHSDRTAEHSSWHLSLNTTNPFEVFHEHVVIAMVGLPARGKSYLSKAITRYMNFLGCRAKLFNAGNMRRTEGLAGTDANFFDDSNKDAKKMRDEMAMACLEELLEWVRSADGCSVGILDATNTTVARRAKLMERVKKEMEESNPNVKLLFVESLADDPVLLEQNYQMKLSNDDYNGADSEKALVDFRKRVTKYEAVYEPISDELDGASTSYIKLINAGQKLISNNVEGYVIRKVQRLLGSIHLKQRHIWLALVGETKNDVRGILGGDPDLSSDGLAYSRDISRLVRERRRSSENDAKSMLVITGTYRRYWAMAHHFEEESSEPCHLMTLGAANDLCSGVMDSLSSEEREARFPLETAARSKDKLNYRYPGVGGESYQDLIARANDIICHLEQSRMDALVIADRAMYRAIMGYFTGRSIQEVPNLDVQPGLLELSRSHDGFEIEHLKASHGKATSSAGVGSKYIISMGSQGALLSKSISWAVEEKC